MPKLTVREMEVLQLICEGNSNIDIAKELIISEDTAKAHVSNILQKLNVSDRVQAAVWAVSNNIYKPKWLLIFRFNRTD